MQVFFHDVPDGRYGVAVTGQNVLHIPGDPVQTLFVVDGAPPEGHIQLSVGTVGGGSGVGGSWTCVMMGGGHAS